MRSFKKDNVVSVAILWGILWTVLHFLFIENGWIDNCLAFYIQLRDSVLQKLALRPWWLTSIIILQAIGWMVIMFMGIRLWISEKNEKSSWPSPRFCHTGAITFKKEKAWVYQNTQDVPKLSKRSAMANLLRTIDSTTLVLSQRTASWHNKQGQTNDSERFKPNAK